MQRTRDDFHILAKNALAIVVGNALVLCCAAISLGQQRASTDTQSRLKYDTPGIQLDGILSERKVYGPPGYGETPAKDKRETILILKLRHSISVEPAAGAEANGSASLDSAKNIEEVQLFVDQSHRADAQKLMGRRVIAAGTLEESITASQYTKVFMDVKSIDAKP
jgi:hypothetical protein